MEPTDALQSIEIALRLAIRQVFGEIDWLDAQGAPDKDKLEDRKLEESKRRDGVVGSHSLIEYTETYHLTNLVRKNWNKFAPVFEDRSRTLAFLDVIDDIRNSIAHSRQLVPFERDLILGIAGMLRNQVSIYRSKVNQSTRYYPLIESVRDNFGTELPQQQLANPRSPNRLEVGEVLTFTGSAFNARANGTHWKLLIMRGMPSAISPPPTVDGGEGDSVVFNYTVTEADVGESRVFVVQIIGGSRYHRWSSYDDERTITYAVNPPEE